MACAKACCTPSSSAEERAKDPLLEFALACNARDSRRRPCRGTVRLARAALSRRGCGGSAHPPRGLLFLRYRLAPPSRRPRAGRLRSGADGALCRRRPSRARHHRDGDLPSLFGRRGFSLSRAARMTFWTPRTNALARRIGLGARLGFALSASRGGRVAALQPEDDTRTRCARGVRVARAGAGDPVQKRLAALAACWAARAKS